MATERELTSRRDQLRRRIQQAREALRKALRLRVPKGARGLIRNLRGRLREIRDNARERLAKVRRRIQRRRKRRQKLVLTPGDPHWGGSDDILRLEVEPIAKRHGFTPNSAKRSETYGNPGSDHHTSQTTASARDFPTVNNFALRDDIARALVGRVLADYENAYFYREGVRFRVQLIAGTHGTGPHLHCGIRRA